jgi:cytosine/adenosine deaminase-related metal-dependent hydrolase
MRLNLNPVRSRVLRFDREASVACGQLKHGITSPDPAPGSAFITNRDALDFATAQGAADVGLGDQIGTLTPGKQADIVAIRAEETSTGCAGWPTSHVTT